MNQNTAHYREVSLKETSFAKIVQKFSSASMEPLADRLFLRALPTVKAEKVLVCLIGKEI
jgi:hypothetical protein